MHYYLNGEHKGYQTFATAPRAKFGPLKIARLQGGFDELRVFDYRLSTAAIKALYDGKFRRPPRRRRLPAGNWSTRPGSTWPPACPGPRSN